MNKMSDNTSHVCICSLKVSTSQGLHVANMSCLAQVRKFFLFLDY